MALNHFEMSMFEDPEDYHYISISGQIENMVDKSKGILDGRGASKSSSYREC